MIEFVLNSDLVTLLKGALIFAALAFLGILLLRSKRWYHLPPGPTGVPILGYLPFLSADTPHLQLEKLRKKYGNVLGMYVGSKFALFLCDLESSKEALNQGVFSGRPDGAFPLSNKTTHFAALNEQPWKHRRKLTFQALRQLGVGTKMIQDVSKSQMRLATKRLEDDISSSCSQDVNVRSFLTYATISVVLNFVCGKTFPPEHEAVKKIESFLKFFAENGSNLTLDMCIPWTKPVLSYFVPYKKETLKIFENMENLLRSEIETHLHHSTENPQDLIDYYLHHYGAQKADDACGDSQAMIFAGSDTVRASTEWFILSMAKHQHIQEKVFQEIHSVLGPDGEIDYEDRGKLPYTEAVILESLRFNTLAPINPYHSSLEDTKFRGYDIPKDSLVFSCLWSIHNDPKYWTHPDQFYPEHFLTPDGGAVKIPEAFVAFAPGKRTCVGEKIALIESFLFSVLFLQHFKVLPPDGGVRMEGHLRVNLEPVHPIVRLVPRSRT